MRLAASFVVLASVAACGGEAASPRLGKRADPRVLAQRLEAAAGLPPEEVGREVAAAVLSQCGDACACLRTAMGDVTVTACPTANASVPLAWPPVELAGRYLAEQLTFARGADRDALAAAMNHLAVPIPRIDPARFPLPEATRQRPLSPARTLVTVSTDGILEEEPMPLARFGARGARIEDAVPGPPTLRGSGAVDPDRSRFGGAESFVLRADTNAALPATAPVVAADRATPAYALGRALRDRGGTIAVTVAGAVRELPLTVVTTPPADTTSWRITWQPGELAIAIGGLISRWPIDADGRYDVAPVTDFLAQATAAGKDGSLVLIGGSLGDAVALLDLALVAGARTIDVTFAEAPSGYGISSGGSHPASAPTGLPSAQLGQPSAVGDLDKAIIRRYVKRNLAKITYCYEKALLEDEDLEGAVDARFFIGPEGTVLSAEATGVTDEVAACVAEVLKGIQFPRPAGGGGVQVRYPFRFVNPY